MQRPGSVVNGNGGRKYLAVYNYDWDVETLLPSEYRNTAPLVASINYTRGNQKGGIDIFLLSEKTPALENVIRIKKEFSLEPGGFKRVSPLDGTEIIRTSELGSVDVTYDIKSQTSNAFPEEVRAEVLEFARADIYDFCGSKVAKTLREGERHRLVPRIIPRTEIERITPAKFLTPGKAEYVPQCILEANIDYTKGCLTSWVPGPEASFDGQVFTDYRQFIWGDCEYCYALRNHRSFPKTIYSFDKDKLLEELKGGAKLTFGSDEPFGRPIEILRFGKRTEPWTPFTENDFIQTLEAMTETGTRGVITTKFLPYKPELADFIKRTQSTILFSTGGSEDVELGPLEWGRTNEFRIEQARLYRERKVNADLFYLMNPLFPPTKDDLQRLEAADKYDIPVQFIPARFYTTNQGVMNKMLRPLAGMQGTSVKMWDFLKDPLPGQGDMLTVHPYANSYELVQGVLTPKLDRMDPFWEKRVGNNHGKTRMCAHDKKTTFCGGCFAKPGTISPTEHELVRIKRADNNRDRKRVRTDQPKPDRMQIGFDFPKEKKKKKSD